MPVHPCSSEGKPGYQWGGHGHCYTYTPNNEQSRSAAHAKATAQGQAAHAHGYQGANDSMDKLENLTNSLNKISLSLEDIKKHQP
jgi:hypothetical protein